MESSPSRRSFFFKTHELFTGSYRAQCTPPMGDGGGGGAGGGVVGGNGSSNLFHKRRAAPSALQQAVARLAGWLAGCLVGRSYVLSFFPSLRLPVC